ncbi:MAG: sugar ABC transporter ATP-binding protein [Planctomycetota bacterium]
MSLVSAQHLTVDFPGVRALDDVSIDFRPGEVHGVIGENGAGKSTLMRVLAGLQKPTRGTLHVDGDAMSFGSAADAQAAGIGMIHQELNLVDELSVAENLLLGCEPRRRGMIDRRAMHEQAVAALKQVGSMLDPRVPLGRLSIAQQQMVEIAKAVSLDSRVLIFDEPTAVLGERESERLYELIAELRGRGVAVIYISHRLAEVRRICDRVSVLRDGKHVATLEEDEIKQADDGTLASLMVGRSMGEMSKHFPPRGEVQGDNVFACDDVLGVSLEVRAGEIVGLAGLIGAGRTEWAEAVVGLRKHVGIVRIGGETVSIRSPRDAIAAGIAYVSEDRKAAGLELEMSIAANTTLATLKRYRHRTSLLDLVSERRSAQSHADALRTKFARLRDPVSSLSGGNQQKVALAKWLDAQPKVLILDEPTRGVDVGAKEEIYRVIAELAAGGMACVVISSELPELIGLCHRIGVLHDGRLVEIFDGPAATEEAIMHAAAGVETAQLSG